MFSYHLLIVVEFNWFNAGRPKVCAEIFCNLKSLSCHVYVLRHFVSIFLSRDIYDKELNCWLLRIASAFPTALLPSAVPSSLSISLSQPRNYLPSDNTYLHYDPLIVACDRCSIVNCVVVIWNHDGNVCIGGGICDTFYCKLQHRSVTDSSYEVHQWLSAPATHLLHV